MKGKGKNLWALVSFLTTVNIFLLYKIHKTGNLRDNWECNYVKEFKIYDIWVFILLSGLVMAGVKIIVSKVLPYLRGSMRLIRKNDQGKFLEKNGKRKVFIIIFCVWFFFFLVMYPGTAMNDTIFILEDPWMLSGQHPIIYNLYTYGLFQLGSLIWNENFGLALISLIQIVAMDYVLSTAVMLLYYRGVRDGICMLLALYFAVAPLFSTYAVSAIKDTPFSIFMFYFMILLYEAGMSHGLLWKQRKFCMKIGVCIWGIGGFRSNGMFIAASVGVFLIIVYWKWHKEILRTIITAVIILAGMKFMLNPPKIERLFQENVGIQLQQVAAVVIKWCCERLWIKYLVF